VVNSAKSWLVQHGSDRHAGFLPLGSAEISAVEKLSPVAALAELLRTLAGAWNSEHPGAPLAAQELAITVPASFDPAAQQLTLEAAQEAGFPASTILLEEPQAAFYAWLEKQGDRTGKTSGFSGLPEGKTSHVLVIDLGGGTTDFSLFSVDARMESPLGSLRRVAVSEHILLGGDNLDLTIAHHLEKRLGLELPPTAFARLVARSREIKEEALASEEASDMSCPVAVALPGASLLAGTLRTEISTQEVRRVLLEGFFPMVGSGERPLKASGGLREAGLPYAKDPAITRHLADFLNERPPVDFVLFNGGLTKAPLIRSRLLENLTRWQAGRRPGLLESSEPDLAVARGAARFLHLKATGDTSRIEAGAAYSYYVGVGKGRGLCVLPQGAAAEHVHTTDYPGLFALLGKAASFPLYRHAKRPDDSIGTVVQISSADLSALPPVETLLSPPKGVRIPGNKQIRVRLRTTLRSTGLLRVELLCAEPSLSWKDPWPLEFSLRSSRSEDEAMSLADPSPADAGKDIPALSAALGAMTRWLVQPLRPREKLTPNALFSSAEKVLGAPKSSWRADTIRALLDGWLGESSLRDASAEHEEVWLHVAGYLLRPGCGLPGDSGRLDSFWTILGSPPRHPRGSVKIQRWLCTRRIAAGLDTERSLILWQQAAPEWKEGAIPSSEIALMAGALESLPQALRSEIAERITRVIEFNPKLPALWTSLGRLLSRALFHAGAAQIVPPERVVEAWERLRDVAVEPSLQSEASIAWLRAARMTGLRAVDVPAEYRKQINNKLRSWGVSDLRRRVLHETVPLVVSERSALLGESLPPGLTILE
jgi:hypothetical protein